MVVHPIRKRHTKFWIQIFKTRLDDLKMKISNRPAKRPTSNDFIDKNNTLITWRTVREGGKLKIAVATDGSLTRSRSGCGVAFDTDKSISWRTRMTQNVFNAEIQAVECAAVLYSENRTVQALELLIFVDSESAVKVLTSDSDVSRSPYCSAILRTRELLLRHKIELIWIPAHSTEKNLNENYMENSAGDKTLFGSYQ